MNGLSRKSSHGWPAMVSSLRRFTQGIRHGSTAGSLSPLRATHGFTLIEVAVTLAVSGILVAILAGFFRNFHHTFNLQEQVADRDLNAHYSVKRFSEVLMSAGANLPSKGWEIVGLPGGNNSNRVKLGVNPRGGIQYLGAATAGFELPIDDAKGFAKATAILVDPQDEAVNVFKVDIDAAYNGNGFSSGVKTAGNGAILRLGSPINLVIGDIVYAYDEEDYQLQGTNLMLDDMVLAENIESMNLSFLTASQLPTNQWSAMRSARIVIRARTASPIRRFRRTAATGKSISPPTSSSGTASDGW